MKGDKWVHINMLVKFPDEHRILELIFMDECKDLQHFSQSQACRLHPAFRKPNVKLFFSPGFNFNFIITKKL